MEIARFNVKNKFVRGHKGEWRQDRHNGASASRRSLLKCNAVQLISSRAGKISYSSTLFAREAFLFSLFFVILVSLSL